MRRPGGVSPHRPPPRTPQRGRPLATTCAWCWRTRDVCGRWIARPALTGARRDCEVSHGLCPDCAARFFLELAGVPIRP